ncbi:malate synthase G [Aurantiacibacter spongiae]|uniref:Malate synthase G n=1 Tax=Aurantiacibacter spongiae TaxID=2488860 RepID=A0A3N5DAQ8_9SPHN|nr:malate synthase G [Aurantiacibacter spongiae]RPF71788.1 malate synthase G [Aurantiacibacter spongiae]
MSEAGVLDRAERSVRPSEGERVDRAGLAVDRRLAGFVETEVLPPAGIEADNFWRDTAALLARFTPANRELLTERERLQGAIDGWHWDNPDARSAAPEAFLREIGYLCDEPAPFTIRTTGCDAEIAELHGPQLVVPVLNARFLLNAANARWGSLYDALYGTDALGDPPPAGGYDAERGARVVAWAKAFLDDAVPLAGQGWADWQGGKPRLAEPSQLVACTGKAIVLKNNGLHIELVIDADHPIGGTDPANIADIRLESALTTIVDLEDSVAAVDAEDKVAAYRNWLGLMRGDLSARFEKGGETLTRELAGDRSYALPGGDRLTLPGRSLLMVRNVGHLMTNPAILLPDGSEVFEGLLDAILTSAIALHDVQARGRYRNSRSGAIYIVKPKMHGPAECAFANDVFDAVEDMLGLARNTTRIGIMDEERRTSANLAACIHAVRERVFFINTGFLDRTGDEIHTSMLAGPMLRKAAIKQAGWLAAYEDRNVQIGLACGFSGRAQIGKGMWAAPDRMAAMLAEKTAHPQSGASTAWVPSPTAATLHATHYHRIDVARRQAARAGEPVAPLTDLLTAPLARDTGWSEAEIAEELDNNIQGILGYVVRWVGQGVGCSKVPDIHEVGLMEDRATLRISSQHIANWLHHGIVSGEQVDAALARMATLVDRQNAGDPAYRPMTGDEDALELAAARALIVEGRAQPSGYTEPLLHAFRRRAKG